MRKNKKRLFDTFGKVKEIYLASFGMFVGGFGLIAWGLYVFKHDWAEDGEYFLMLPMLSFVLLPMLGLAVIFVCLLISTAWFYLKSGLSRPKVNDDQPVAAVQSHLRQAGFSVDDAENQVRFSLEKYAALTSQQKPFVRTDADVLTSVQFIPTGRHYLFSTTYKYAGKNLPSFLINSILNDKIIATRNAVDSNYVEVPLPGDTEKIFRAYAAKAHTAECLQVLSPDKILYLIREGYEFDYICQGDEITLLFVNALDVSTVDTYLRKTGAVLSVLLANKLDAQSSAGALRRLISKAAIVDKQLNSFVFAALKTLLMFMFCMTVFMFAGSALDSQLGTLAFVVSLVSFLAGFAVLLALLALTSVVLYVPMVYALLRSMDWVRNRVAVGKALRDHEYLKQKYGY
jgi:hypothetical protein